MHGERCAAAKFADIRRQVRRLVRGPPEEPRDHQSKIEQADADVNIDPERPRLSRNIVEKKPKGVEEDDQRGGRPMKSYGAGAATRGCRRYALLYWQTGLAAESECEAAPLRNVFLRAVVCSGLDRKRMYYLLRGASFQPIRARNSFSQGRRHGVQIGAAHINFRNVVAVATERLAILAAQDRLIGLRAASTINRSAP
jgi:hypothetical protein